MWTTFIVLVLTVASLARTENGHCPPMVCSCQERSANCSQRGLIKLPPGLPLKLKNLDLSQNKMDSINSTMLLLMSDLEVLDLSLNFLSELRFDGAHYKLRKLDLSSNNFTTVRSLKIEGLLHLTELNLASNKIISLPSNAFPGGSFLQRLNLKNNRLEFLDEGCTSSLTSLETLILTRNFLSSFPKGLFTQMKSLIELEVNKNKFVEIQGLTFHGLENLKVLRLKRNQIEFLMDGAFFGLTNIEEISLDRNKINIVKKGWLYGLNTLRYLSMSQNNVDFVDEDAWEFCVELNELDLRSNKFQSVDRSTLSGLPSLRHLYLQDNMISHLGNPYEDPTFADVPLLETLALDGNEISHTIEDMEAPFKGLVNLKSLSLGNNLIKSIGNRAFLGLDSLETIDVRDNVISTVQENAFKNLPRLQSIHLNSGSILCDCYLKWFPKWLNETTGFHRTHVTATCAHPELLKGHYITYVPYERYTCDDFPKPYILQHPDTQVTLHGDSLKLSCRAASTSPADMKFEWKVDSDRVEADEASPDCSSGGGRCVRYYPHSFDGKGREITSELHLSNLTYDDAGRYQCVVQNKYGVTYSERANITVYVFPAYVVTPEDIVVEAGSSARMECAAQGVPAPKMTWKKDFGADFHAADERRIKSIQPNDDQFTSVNSFIMQKVKGDDSGVYTCTAENPAGIISWNMSLSVLDMPRFVKPMKNKTATEGETAVIECRTSGSPKPKLTWSKDGVNFEEIQRQDHFFAADNQLLVIVNTRLADSGLYKCTVSNSLGSQTQSSSLTVNIKSAYDIGIPSISGGSGAPTAQGWTHIIIVSIVCGIMVIVMILVVCMMCKKVQRSSTRNPNHTSFSGGHGNKADHEFTTPFFGGQLAGQANLNQYTTPDDHHRRTSATSEIGVVKIMDGGGGGPAASPQARGLNPQLPKAAVDLQLRTIPDSSSERDSGTGDSRKSRDNLDEVDDISAIDHHHHHHLQTLSPLLMSSAVSASGGAPSGGGESTMSLADFEDTHHTHLDTYEDPDMDPDEDEETGCGEAMLSASNSIASGSKSSSSDSEYSESVGQASSCNNQEQVPVSFRTFHPMQQTNSRLSLSRDFLNNRPLPPRPVQPRTNPLKKRSSAIELNNGQYGINGQKHLEIEIERTDSESQHHPLDPVAYRGGLPISSTPLNKGLEVNEKLIDYSLRSTDYSLHETSLVRGSHGRSDFVNSLPRRKHSKHHTRKKGQNRKADPKKEELLYTTVPLKDDKMF